MQGESASLYFQSGNSDKVYFLNLQQCETGWAVLVQWGRRGSTLQADTKIERVPYEDAKPIYDRVLREKLAKGYQYSEAPAARKPAASEPLTRNAPVSKEVVFAPELLTRIEESEALRFGRDPRYWFQWKRDGIRLTVVAEQIKTVPWTFNIYGYNKLGQVVQLDPQLRRAIETLCIDGKYTCLLLDGEWEASGFYVWDILECNSDLRETEYQYRFKTLETVLGTAEDAAELPDDLAALLHIVQTGKTTQEKARLLADAKAKRAEGIAVKKITARYCGGRNGNHFKYKFEQVASFIVGPKPPKKANDGHRSVALYAYDRGRKRFIATVKVADKYAVPGIGAIIDVRYLYLHPGPEGRIYQPAYFGVVRNDVRPTDCLVQQLKLKQTDEEAAA